MTKRIKARITRRGAKAFDSHSLARAIVEMDVKPWKTNMQMAVNVYKDGQRIGGSFCSHDDDGVRRWNEIK